MRLNGIVAVGFFAALPLFNQIYLGTNFSLIWALVPLTCMANTKKSPSLYFQLLLIFLSFFLLKYLFVVNIEAILRYFTYIVFVASLAVAYRRREMDDFFSGFEKGVVLNVAFACIQMMGLITGRYDLVFDLTTWNPTLWHYNPPGGMIPSYPRVSGLTNEPAYFGVIVLTSAMYRLFVRKPAHLWRYHVWLFVVIIFLINSRTAFIAYIVLTGLTILLDTRLCNNLFLPRVIFICSFLLLPITLVWSADRNYHSNGFYDYDAMFLDDVSIFARTVPLIWIKEMNNLNIIDYVFGVANYREYAPGVNMPTDAYVVAGLQGAFLDSKSLGGSYFYDLGFVGIFMFISAFIYMFWRNARALLMFAVLNITYFNIYAFSWPLYWLMIACCICSVDGVFRTSRPLSKRLSLTRIRANGIPATAAALCDLVVAIRPTWRNAKGR